MTTYGTIPASPPPGPTNLRYLSAKSRIISGLGMRRAWMEMLNLRWMNLPNNLSHAFSRVRTNVGYFRMNYAIVMLSILFLSLLWHPVSLIVFVAMMSAWMFLYFLRDEPLVVFRRMIDDSVVLVVLFVLTVVLLLLTGATMNIFSSVLIGLTVVVVHGVFRRSDDLILDEDVTRGGYLASTSSSS